MSIFWVTFQFFVLVDERHDEGTPATIELLETIDDDLDKFDAHLVTLPLYFHHFIKLKELVNFVVI